MTGLHVCVISMAINNVLTNHIPWETLSHCSEETQDVTDHPTTVEPPEHLVFCHYKEDRGCEWQGKPSDLEHHLQSCPMKEPPLKTTDAQEELSKSTV